MITPVKKLLLNYDIRKLQINFHKPGKYKTIFSYTPKYSNMKKQLFLKVFSFILMLTVFVLASCNENAGGKNNTASATNTGEKNTAATTPPVAFISGTLDTLWTDSLSFTKLKKAKAYFAFYAGTNDTFTLHGWEASGLIPGSYNTPPDIKLVKGRASTITFGTDTYFGNVLLKDVSDIQKKLKTNNAKYVLFAPEKNGAYISYKIFLTNDTPPALIKTFAIINTGSEANPSPPKTY